MLVVLQKYKNIGTRQIKIKKNLQKRNFGSKKKKEVVFFTITISLYIFYFTTNLLVNELITNFAP